MTKEKFYRSINHAVSVLMRKNNNRGVIFGGEKRMDELFSDLFFKL